MEELRKAVRPNRAVYFDFMNRVWSMPPALLSEILAIGIIPDLEFTPDVKMLKRRPTNAIIVKLSHDERSE